LLTGWLRYDVATLHGFAGRWEAVTGKTASLHWHTKILGQNDLTIPVLAVGS
jgi:hypothetical protein